MTGDGRDARGECAPRVVVVTTSYPEYEGDAQGHFVASEVRRLTEAGSDVTVLAPGAARRALGRETVVSLGGAQAFGFPGAVARLRENPWRVLTASRFVVAATRWLRRAPTPDRAIAHFLLPCGVPIATRGLAGRRTELEVVVHGSDARLFDALLLGQRFIGTELRRSGAHLRFVSSELERLVLGGLSAAQRQHLQPLSRIEPCAIDVAPLTRSSARQQLGIEDSAHIAVIVARLVPGKRVEVALEACSRIPNLKTIIVGDGPERPQLAARFPLAQFVGHVPRSQALSYLAAANVLVSASLHEGAPTVVREARALGTPVVCLAAGDLSRWAQTDPDLHVVA